MLVPLQVAGVESFSGLEGRLRQLRQAAWSEDDAIVAEAISRLTSGRRGGSDSLHLVVVDAHHDLNQLAGSLATESIAGALVYAIKDADRALVHAFASEVGRTQRRTEGRAVGQVPQSLPLSFVLYDLGAEGQPP